MDPIGGGNSDRQGKSLDDLYTYIALMWCQGRRLSFEHLLQAQVPSNVCLVSRNIATSRALRPENLRS